MLEAQPLPHPEGGVQRGCLLWARALEPETFTFQVVGEEPEGGRARRLTLALV